MEAVNKLLEALEECGEAAMAYRGRRIVAANALFAAMLERSVEECAGLEIIELCAEESIEMIQDYMRRRAFGDHNLPACYSAAFRTPSRPRVMLTLTVVKLHAQDIVLVILREEE